MARYIDADALKKRLDLVGVVADGVYGMGINRGLDRAETEIDMLPTADVVPVVRCKDCEHGQFMPSCSMYLCRCTGGKLRYADDYCNYGERKEQE